jgi:hypothetical protein
MRWTTESLEAEIRRRGGTVTLVGSVSAEDAARALGSTVRAMERWRGEGIGPPSHTSNGKATGRRYYYLADLAAHLNQAERAA